MSTGSVAGFENLCDDLEAARESLDLMRWQSPGGLCVQSPDRLTDTIFDVLDEVPDESEPVLVARLLAWQEVEKMPVGRRPASCFSVATMGV